jgi:hypothetical protein
MIKNIILIIIVFFANDCNSHKKKKIFKISNLSSYDLQVVLIHPNANKVRCEIAEFRNQEKLDLGYLTKYKIMLVKFPDDTVLAYYIGVFIGVSDPEFLNSFYIVNLTLLEDKKIYVKSHIKNQEIQIQPNEGKGIDFPLMQGSNNEVIDSDITDNAKLKINLDSPDLDYKNYNLNKDNSKILKACFSIFNEEKSKDIHVIISD